MNDNDITEMEAKHQANVDQARELLHIIKSVGARQTYWKDLLEEVYETEAREEEQTRALSKEVLLQEAESLANVDFVTWLSKRNVRSATGKSGDVGDALSNNSNASNTSAGLEGLANWFHSDLLALESPFSAMVPFPRRISDEGAQFVSESVSDLMFSPEEEDTAPPPPASTSPPSSLPPSGAYVYTVLANQPHTRLSALLNVNVEAPREKSSSSSVASSPAASYCRIPCRSGKDVVALCTSSVELKQALDHHPCIFLTNKVLPIQCVAKVAVVGGVPVAVQVDDHNQRAENGSASATSLPQESVQELARFLLQDVIGTALSGRTFYALLGAVASTQRSGGFRWTLLGVDILTGQELECFAERELQMLARVLVPLHRKLKTLAVRNAQAAASAAGGGQEQGTLLTWTCVVRQFDASAAAAAAEANDDADHLRLAEDIRRVIDTCRDASARTSQEVNDSTLAAVAEAKLTMESVNAPLSTPQHATPLPQGTDRNRGDGGAHSNAFLAATIVSTVAATLGAVLVVGKLFRPSK